MFVTHILSIFLLWYLFLSLFTLFAFSNIVFHQENDDLIMNSLIMSQTTYCDITKYNVINSFNIIHYDLNNRGVRALVGYNFQFKSIIVAYRGSENIINWINNMRMKQIYPYTFDSQIGVEQGFYNSYSKLYSEILNCIFQLSNQYKTNRIMLTGHSLGSIVTYLLIDLIHYDTQFQIISVITFGSPRLGNEHFANYINLLNSNNSNINAKEKPIVILRITHNCDIVPYLPPNRMNYFHINHELWFSEKNDYWFYCTNTNKSNYLINSCNNTCNYQDLNIDDHLYYLNITLGSSGQCLF